MILLKIQVYVQIIGCSIIVDFRVFDFFSCIVVVVAVTAIIDVFFSNQRKLDEQTSQRTNDKRRRTKPDRLQIGTAATNYNDVIDKLNQLDSANTNTFTAPSTSACAIATTTIVDNGK